MIISAKYTDEDSSAVSVTYADGRTVSVPVASANRHYQELVEWVSEGNEIEPFWIESLANLKEKMLSDLSKIRWQKEIAGFYLDDSFIRSDERSQNMLVNAISLLENDPNRTEVNWNLPDGSFATIDLPTLRAMGIAMGAHVQATFDRKKVLIDQLNVAATIEELEAIDIESGWPS